MPKEFHVTAIPYPSNSKELNINEEIRLITVADLFASQV